MNLNKSSLAGTSLKLALGVGISIFAVNASQAGIMTFQMRAVNSGYLFAGDVTSPGVVIDGSGNATAPSGGATIVFQLSVVFNGGTDPTTGKIAVSEGAIVSFGTSGSLLNAGAGAIVGHNVANYNALGAAPGLVGSDLSAQYPYTGTAASVAPTAAGTADGITDVGTTIALATSTTNWFATNTAAIAGFGNGTNTATIGEFVLTLAPGATSGSTSIGYFLRPTVTGTTTAKNYNTGSVDGANFAFNYAGNVANAGAQAAYNAQSPVTITVVPEPSAFAMLALGALGLVGFRRMSLRRTA